MWTAAKARMCRFTFRFVFFGACVCVCVWVVNASATCSTSQSCSSLAPLNTRRARLVNVILCVCAHHYAVCAVRKFVSLMISYVGDTFPRRNTLFHHFASYTIAADAAVVCLLYRSTESHQRGRMLAQPCTCTTTCIWEQPRLLARQWINNKGQCELNVHSVSEEKCGALPRDFCCTFVTWNEIDSGSRCSLFSKTICRWIKMPLQMTRRI